MVTWGLVAAAWRSSPAPAASTLRFLLGVAEAGFFPGIILYLTFWFPQRERARMTALFMAAIPVSSAIGAPLSSLLIEHGEGLLGLSGWRVMFPRGDPRRAARRRHVVLPHRPAGRRRVARASRARALTAALDADDDHKSRTYHVSIRESLTSGRVWALAFVYFGIVYGLYALGFFLPTIIKGFEQQFGTSYSLLERGLINAVPYAVGVVAMLWWARHGDRRGERVWHVALPAFIGGAAIPVALHLGSPAAAMAAVTVCAVGVMRAADVLGAPDRLPHGRRRSQRHRAGQLRGQHRGLRRAVTGWLADLTGSQKTGLWLVGAVMVAPGRPPWSCAPHPSPRPRRRLTGRGLKTRVRRRTAT